MTPSFNSVRCGGFVCAYTCIFCLVSVAGCSHLQSVTKLRLECMYIYLSSDLAPSFSRSPWFHISSLEEKDGEKMMEGLLETGFLDPAQIRNHTVHVTETDDEYERLVSDVWVGIVLILMILSCIGCVCSCLLYHKFQQWKHHSSGASRDSSPEIGEVPRRPSNESLPSYTLVTGLPTYEQALEQAKLGVCLRPPQASLVTMAPPPPASPAPKMPPPPFHEVKS